MRLVTAEPPSEEMEAAAALLRGEQQGAASAALLGKVLNNIVSKPGEEKYRWVEDCVTSMLIRS